MEYTKRKGLHCDVIVVMSESLASRLGLEMMAYAETGLHHTSVSRYVQARLEMKTQEAHEHDEWL